MNYYTVLEVSRIIHELDYNVYHWIKQNRIDLVMSKCIINNPRRINAQGIMMIIKGHVDDVYYNQFKEHYEKTGEVLKWSDSI
jgi:hypothetical protein